MQTTIRSGCALVMFAASIAVAQSAPPRTGPQPHAAASSRATVSVALDGRMIGTNWLPAGVNLAGPATIAIEYGQPHLRGRPLTAESELLRSPYDTIWRLGANLATHLQTDVNLVLGGTRIPRGRYTLFLRLGGAQPMLIVNQQTGQWGTEYDSRLDLVRIPITQRTLSENSEAFTIWLVPAPQGAEGTLRMVWGKTEWTSTWKASLQ